MTTPARGYFRAAPKVSPYERVRDFARVQVRAGLLNDDALLAEVVSVVAADLPAEDPTTAAAAILGLVRAELLAEERAWRSPTDHERLLAAFSALEQERVIVLQAVEDHWVANAELRRRAAAGEATVGVVWFTAPDVWHAVDHGMLELNVWHPDTANVAPGEPLLDLVVSTLAAHGVAGHFDEGRVEVAAHWQRPLQPPQRHR